MSRIHIEEGYGNVISDLASVSRHHQSRGHEDGRTYATAPNGEEEEIRYVPRDNGNQAALYKKDLALVREDTNSDSGVPVPSPVAGYVSFLRDNENAMVIYDKPYVEGQPEPNRLAYVLHTDANNTLVKEGQRVEYGQPIAIQGDTGSPGAIHLHVEAEYEVLKKYVADISSGALTTEGASKGVIAPEPQPAQTTSSPSTPNAAKAQLLQSGDTGPQVEQLQAALNKAGQNTGDVDGRFGPATKAAVEAFQHSHNLTADGIAGPDTLKALAAIQGQSQTSPTSPASVTTTGGSDIGAQLRSADLKNTPIYLAIGLAEGTIGRDGAPTEAYSGHKDYGNGELNKGFGSYQVSQHPKGAGLTPEEADRVQADRLAEQWPRVDRALNEAGFKPGPQRDLIAANALDSWNQAPLTFEDRHGLMNKEQLAQLKQSIDSGTSPQAAITEWRAQSYRDNNGNLDAPGLGNSMERVREDQGRRVAAVAEGLELRPVQQTLANSQPTPTDKPQTPSDVVAAGLAASAAAVNPTATIADKPQTSANAQPMPTDKPQTLATTHDQVQQPTQSDKSLMSSPNHPDNKLYQQAVSNLEQLGSGGGFKSREDLEKAAASVAADAKATGLQSIDHISKTNAPNGQSYLVAVQGDPTSPASKNSYIDYNQATSQTVAQSTQMSDAQKPAIQLADQSVVQQERAMVSAR